MQKFRKMPDTYGTRYIDNRYFRCSRFLGGFFSFRFNGIIRFFGTWHLINSSR